MRVLGQRLVVLFLIICLGLEPAIGQPNRDAQRQAETAAASRAGA